MFKTSGEKEVWDEKRKAENAMEELKFYKKVNSEIYLKIDKRPG